MPKKKAKLNICIPYAIRSCLHNRNQFTSECWVVELRFLQMSLINRAGSAGFRLSPCYFFLRMRSRARPVNEILVSNKLSVTGMKLFSYEHCHPSQGDWGEMFLTKQLRFGISETKMALFVHGIRVSTSEER